ncbi:hypothetical protein DPEC_G00045670 [Dallia pectoralis]|uniref:Uncharacterized protein n=1 Tax=Dallia pectoralis TaxID=75939 RepID=A0ACC2H9Z4_DALPE|nr:hypothetical protein DPEC_G00045670 [Dallia pectoralis]
MAASAGADVWGVRCGVEGEAAWPDMAGTAWPFQSGAARSEPARPSGPRKVRCVKMDQLAFLQWGSVGSVLPVREEEQRSKASLNTHFCGAFGRCLSELSS